MIAAKFFTSKFFIGAIAFITLSAPPSNSVSSSSSGSDAGSTANSRSGKGSLILMYEPKYCLLSPCPQFKVLEENGKMARGGADVLELDLAKAKLKPSEKIVITGAWTREGNYLKIKAETWKALLPNHEKPSTKRPATD